MANIQFLSSRLIVRYCAILLMTGLLTAGVFKAECRACLLFSKPEYKGKVIDLETGEPIEGVAVVAIYWRHQLIGGPAGPDSYAINWKEALTDENGVFRIPAYWRLISPNSEAGKTEFVFYKPGYGRVPYSIEPSFLRIVGPDEYLTKEIGKKGEASWGTAEEITPEGRKRIIPKHRSTFTYGIIKLRRLNTWDERRLADPSLPWGAGPTNLPETFKYIEQETEWRRQNKGWRRYEQDN